MQACGVFENVNSGVTGASEKSSCGRRREESLKGLKIELERGEVGTND